MTGTRDVLPPTLFGFIRQHSLRPQILVTLLTLSAFPFLYLSLDLPKQIVNEAIGGKDFPRDMMGMAFDQLDLLVLLAFGYLGLVLINGAFKYVINTYKGRLGERMLRRLRYALYERILRFPPGHFARVAPSQYIPMITAEAEPLGGFIGDAVSLPVFQGGTLLTLLAFMFVQDWMLGLAAVALYPLQVWLIPKLQRKVLRLQRKRIKLVRALSDRLGETAAGLDEIHAQGLSRWLLADFSQRMHENFLIRYEIFKWKFLVKFLNNFLAQLTPFFFFLLGGWLVISGDLSFGALVAVLAAYKDLNSPWKELLDYYQQLQDNQLRYQQVVEQFGPEGMRDPTRAAAPVAAAPRGSAELSAEGLTMTDAEGRMRVDAATLTIAPGARVAVVGSETSGRRELLMGLAGLAPPFAGVARLDGVDLAQMTHADIAARIGHVGANPPLLSGSLYEALTAGLRRAPRGEVDPRFALEAMRTGNTTEPALGDWIDYAAAGCADEAELRREIERVLTEVGLFAELREFALDSVVDPDPRPALVAAVLAARRAIRRHLPMDEVRGFYEPFDPDRFNDLASVGENLIFGSPVDARIDLDALGEIPHVRRVLAESGLDKQLLRAGVEAARQLCDIFSALPPGHELIRTYSLVEPEELAAFEQMLARQPKEGDPDVSDGEAAALISLALRLVPARHRLGVIDARIKVGIIDARPAFAKLPPELAGAIEPHQWDRYNRSATIRQNIIFGREVPGQESPDSRMRALILAALERAGARDAILDELAKVGLDAPVGVGGGRLSPAARQRVAAAAVLLRRPDALIFNDALSPLDPDQQARLIQAALDAAGGRTVVWALPRADLARGFEQVAVMRSGRIVEWSRPEPEHAGPELRALLGLTA